MRWTFFKRMYSSYRTIETANIGTMDIEIDTDDLKVAIAAHRKVSVGNHLFGVFEVQNEEGVYQQIDGKRIELDTPRKAAQTVFTSWKEMEDAEDAGIELPSKLNYHYDVDLGHDVMDCMNGKRTAEDEEYFQRNN